MSRQRSGVVGVQICFAQGTDLHRLIDLANKTLRFRLFASRISRGVRFLPQLPLITLHNICYHFIGFSLRFIIFLLLLFLIDDCQSHLFAIMPGPCRQIVYRTVNKGCFPLTLSRAKIEYGAPVTFASGPFPGLAGR